jgi:hypothetical protein
VKRTIYEAPHYAVTSRLPIIPSSNNLLSILFSDTHNLYFSETMFHIHTKEEEEIIIIIIIIINIQLFLKTRALISKTHIFIVPFPISKWTRLKAEKYKL